MFKGFYMAASGMLTQSRVLNTISNNMANASTPGYKGDTLATTTFGDILINRTGNKDKSVYTPLNNSSMIKTADELVTNYKEGALEFTDRKLDFAINGNGFFQIQTANGENKYTRNGSLNIDGDGYLCLQHIGRVMGENGPIQLGTDKINVSEEGNITHSETGESLGKIRLVNFTDYTQVQKVDEGMFETTNPLNTVAMEGRLKQGALERSNVQAMDEMMAMMASQRAFQSAGQIAKEYDQLMGKAVELGAL
ncbi:MAG: flagellar hook-basal body complex protein [Clostridiales bacterium]|jgi:flagellar basal-body rod protein FlgG|uniref:flagellar hook-basal body protein n=1 Tax=Aminipila sp. TaxID=2060095 RepID=UPI001D231000|nr:flagellar hook-basal body complex protein [Aminipila sp.]MBE6033234.1 flagellar hook-basal body complex protein [Clostridiales bacterium]